MKENSKFLYFAIIILLALISFGVYFNALSGDFLIDDQTGIINNEHFHDIKTYFTKYFSVRPAVLHDILRVACWHFAKDRPYLYHLASISFHIICVILLFILTNILFKNRTLSFLSCLIFAVHPIHTEVISWISGDNYVFSGMFFIASFIFYVKSDKSILNLTLSVILFCFCFLAGNAVSTLPLLFIIYELFFKVKKENRKGIVNLKIIILFITILISILYIGVFFVARDKFMRLIFHYRGFSYLIVVAKAFVYYLKILYMPLARGLYHPFSYNIINIHQVSPAFFLSLTILIISLAAFFRYIKRYPAVSFGIAWFFITYAPYSNIIPVCNIISERYLYLPSFGFCLLLAAVFIKAWEVINRSLSYRRIFRAIAVVTLTLFVGSYAALTIKRNYEYNDIFTYWSTNINNFPDGYVVYNNLAATYFVQGNYANAIAYCWINLLINPAQPHVWCNLGMVYHKTGDLNQAKECYLEALKIDKDYKIAKEALVGIDAELKKANAPAKSKKN